MEPSSLWCLFMSFLGSLVPWISLSTSCLKPSKSVAVASLEAVWRVRQQNKSITAAAIICSVISFGLM